MANPRCSQKFKVFCVFICIHNIVRLCDASLCQRSSSKFSVQPTDSQIRRGENAGFQCSVADFNPDSKSIRWKVYPHPKTTPLNTEMYDAVNRVLISNITIQSSSTHTQLYISCILEEIVLQETLCFSSRQVVLDTIYFPAQDDLSCYPSSVNEMNIGETLTLKCSVPRGNPPVDLTWTIRPGGKMFPPSLNDGGSLRVLTHELFITSDLHLKIVLCDVSSAFSFPGEKLQCSVGPILVLHPPQVHIFPQSKTITSHEQVELTCIADAYPEVNNFTWTCFPEEVLEGCGITSSSRHSFTLNMVRPCVPMVEGVHITCSATNSEGTGKSYAYLHIARHSVNNCGNNYTTQQNNQDFFSNLEVSIHLYQNVLSQNYLLQCMITGPSILRSAHFQWYIDDLPIIDKHRVLIQTQPFMSTITFQRSFQKHNFTKTFTCVATSKGMSSTASTNLSSLWNTQKLVTVGVSGDSPLMSDEMTSLLLKEFTTEITTSASSNLFVEGDLNPNEPMIKPFIMMLLSGVILLIAIIMIIISVYLCSAKRKNRKEIDPSSGPKDTTAKPITTNAITEYCTNIKMVHVDDPLYEVPNAHSAKTSVLFESHSSSSSTQDVMDTCSPNLCQDCSIRNSKDSSWTNSSDSQSSHCDDISLQYDYASAPCGVLYTE